MVCSRMKACITHLLTAICTWVKRVLALGWRQGWPQLTRIWSAARHYVLAVYTEPFHQVDAALLQNHTLAEIEQGRRTALLRCIVLSFALGSIAIFFLLFAFAHLPGAVRLGNASGTLLCIGCLLLSYSRFRKLASLLFLIASLTWVLIFTLIDRSGLSIRSALFISAVDILILGAGLLLPHRLIWPVIGVMIALGLLVTALLPIKAPFPAVILYPRRTVLIYLALLYSFTAVLTWLYVRSTAATLQSIAAVFAQAYAIEQQKDTFLHVASHELRAPLTPLILGSRLLEKRLQRWPDAPHEITDLARDLAQHAKRMNGMVDLLLDVTRIDRQQFSLEIEECDIAQIVRDAVATQQLIARRPITTVGCDLPLPGAADPRRLWQVLTNLISNALKYTPVETAVEVALHEVHERPGWLQIAVADLGPGIPAAELPHLFDRYYRAAGTAQMPIEGWGLGLYVCQAIVTAHGGTIEVASTLGAGTTFTVTLPRFTPAHSP